VLFAGDRQIAVDVMDVLLEDDVHPVGLLLSSADDATHQSDLRSRCSHLAESAVFTAEDAFTPDGIEALHNLAPDYLLCVHFPYIIPDEVLEIPAVAPLNLHPAYLPFNRGWHTPSWAILEGTPYGATLHVMTDELDSGPILRRSRLEIRPEDTAHTLYQRVLDLEARLFADVWPALRDGSVDLTRPDEEGSAHRKSDLFDADVQRLDAEATARVGDLIDRLRALTTDRWEEAAYIERNGRRYRIQVDITAEPEGSC
jgi:methionyl-tRNA formyltransferase